MYYVKEGKQCIMLEQGRQGQGIMGNSSLTGSISKIFQFLVLFDSVVEFYHHAFYFKTNDNVRHANFYWPFCNSQAKSGKWKQLNFIFKHNKNILH